MATHNGKAAGGQSVTGHPMFPALVALWFAALFGLGSLAIRPALLEQVVLDLGIDTVIAAAAPPLGTTFRILLALAMSAFGGLLGAVVARRVRGSSRPAPATAPRRARDSHPDAPPRRPISAREEFGDDEMVEVDTGPQPIPGRRRALAMSEDTRPSDFHEYAPLPGAALPNAFDPTARLDALVEKLGPDAERAQEAPLELTEDVEADSLEQPTAGGAFAPPDEGPRESNKDLQFGRPPELVEVAFDEPLAEADQEIEIEPEQVFSAPPRAFAPPPDRVAAEPERDTRQSAPASAAECLAARPLEHLSTAELSERLAIALELRRQRQAMAAVAREAAALAAAMAMPEPEPVTAAAFVPEPVQAAAAPTIPAALRPLDLAFDDEAGDDDNALPQRRFSLAAMAPQAVSEPVEAPAEPAAEGDPLDDDTLAEGYSSLLDLSRPGLRDPFVRIDDDGDDDAAIEPVVTFPGQAARRAATHEPATLAQAAPADVPAQPAPAAPAMRRFDAPAAGGVPPQPASLGSVPALDREEADRALRAALATLQRMSGAA